LTNQLEKIEFSDQNQIYVPGGRVIRLFFRHIWLFFLLGVFLHVGYAQAHSSPVPLIVVGGDRDYPPYEFIDKDGKPSGFNVDLTRAIAEVMGMKVEFHFGAWSDMRSDLKSGRVDVLPGLSYSEERTKEVAYSPPHSIVNHAIFARRDSPAIHSLDELAGKEVAVLRDGIMHEYLVQHKFSGKLILTDTPADALRQLASGKLDYAVVAIVPGMYLIRELKLTNLVPLVHNVATQRFCFAVRKGNDELLSHFSEGLAILKKTGQYDAIYTKWLGVLEPQKLDWVTTTRNAAVVVVPLILLAGGMGLWSHMLRRQVSLRTADLTREVAERRAAEEELRVNQQHLVQADKMAALGILVSGVAHEINNPNGLILLNMPILREVYTDAAEILDQHYHETGDFSLGGLPYSRMHREVPLMLEEMQEGAKRIKRIVEDLKDFARRDDNADMEPVDLNAVVQAAVRLVDSSIRKSTVRFQADYEEFLPLVRGNAQRIEQVVVNLILNACQSLDDTGKAIELTTFFDPVSGSLVVHVLDEGSGIAPEHLPRLTDPFFTTKRENGGTGLGLSISAGIVKEHGGSLTFNSVPGKGTAVTLMLPSIHNEVSP
jgi:signal transduction histidine kinase